MSKLNMNNGDYIAAVTFGYDMKREDYFKDEPLKSLELLKSETGANAIVLAFHAMQDDPQSVVIDYLGSETPSKEGLKRIIDKARELDMAIILKPMLDCRNGTWRGHINFFDKDIPCEPKWCDWFKSYTEFQVYFAKIAEELECDMLCIACEMVQTQRRDADWRNCIAEIRKHYSGPITWNCDKYQEDEVTFWDALDVISASGYYPINQWENELSRISTVVEKYKKPFFFIECGCMTCKSSPAIPNQWIRFQNEVKDTADKMGIDYEILRNVEDLYSKNSSDSSKNILDVYKAVVDFDAQADFYKTVFEACDKFPFVQGFGLWDWNGFLRYNEETVCYDGGYGLHLKPSVKVVKEYFIKKAKAL